jgi:hypothetical protein
LAYRRFGLQRELCVRAAYAPRASRERLAASHATQLLGSPTLEQPSDGERMAALHGSP